MGDSLLEIHPEKRVKSEPAMIPEVEVESYEPSFFKKHSFFKYYTAPMLYKGYPYFPNTCSVLSTFIFFAIGSIVVTYYFSTFNSVTGISQYTIFDSFCTESFKNCTELTYVPD